MRVPRTVLFLLVTGLPIFAAKTHQSPDPAQNAPLAFIHVDVIEMTGAPVKKNHTVVILHGRIASVAPYGAQPVPAGARVVDATGRFLIPGLWDMHVHWYDERFLGLFVANGVTGVRQMWGMPLHLNWSKRIAANDLLGPRFSIASSIVDGPEPVWPGSVVVTNEAEARDVVREVKRQGYGLLKIYNGISRDAFFAMSEEARKEDVRIAGHVPDAVTAAEASDAGMTSIEHLEDVLYSASSAEKELRSRRQELRTVTGAPVNSAIRDGRRALRERLLDTYDAVKATALFRRLARNNTWQCPTLTVLRSMALLDDATFTMDSRLKYMPRSIRESWKPANDFRLASSTAADFSVARRSFRKHVEIVGAMRAAGVKVLAGTDTLNPFTFPGFSLHDEMGLLVEAGLSPLEALQTATLNAATYEGLSGVLGTVEPGKVADLVLLDANPLEDIAHTRRISAVILNGRLIDRRGLDDILAKAEKTANLKSIGGTLSRTLEEKGVPAAVEQYHELRTRQPDAFDFSEDELNTLGYTLLSAKKADQAIEIFKLNVEAFPRSANAHDSLGEAFMAQGNRERAIESYRAALRIDPGNVNAALMLRKLEKQ